jgi:uracil-DNA glycosylase
VTTLEELAREAASCTRCDLYQRATATVFGEGRPHSPLALVGEQPGDQEDKQSHPFVGPAGHVLDRALHDSGIKRADAYVTNAVKHFKWEARGKRRIHQRPRSPDHLTSPWREDAGPVRRGPGQLSGLGLNSANMAPWGSVR